VAGLRGDTMTQFDTMILCVTMIQCDTMLQCDTMRAIAKYSVPPPSHMNRFTVTPQHITLSEGRQRITHILYRFFISIYSTRNLYLRFFTSFEFIVKLSVSYLQSELTMSELLYSQSSCILFSVIKKARR
jgi:hypothetical protein